MKKIFVPYDFSENASNTLVYALKLAASAGLQMTVFHALAISAKIMAAPVTEDKRKEVISKEETDKTQELKQEVEMLMQVANAGLSSDRVTCKVNFGPIVVENIIYAAEEEGADLIVMGTHGASGLKKFLFGSVTSSVISKSSIPVLAVPNEYVFSEIKSIAYASDLENPDAEISRILPFSQALHAGVRILHYDYGFKKQDEVSPLLNKYPATELVVKKADSSITLLKQIRQFIMETHPQWIVMFTRERSMWDKLFMSSKTEEMATALEIPLLSFRKEGEEGSGK